MRSVVAVLAVATVGVGISACGSSSSAPATASGGPRTAAVHLDGKADNFNGAFTAFFPSSLTVHAGDAIDFQLPHFSGEPHTVTVGTLVDAALGKLQKLGPTATLAAQESSTEMLNLPDVFPHKVGQGVPDANQSAGQPCFLDGGVPPLSLTGGAPACPKRDQPDFDGTQSFFNSGLLQADGDHFSLKLSSTTRPGAYHAMCMVHRSAMTATINVVASGATAQTADEIDAAGEQQFQKLVTTLQPVADASSKLTAENAAAGLVDPNTFNALVAQFGPKDISVPLGGTVSWHVFSFHTITFNAQEGDVGVLTKAADGSVHLSPKAGVPSNITVPPVLVEFPPADDAKPITVDGGKFDGTGAKSTGLIGSLPPQLVTVKITFTKAGTYPYRCLVHPDMKGNVKVG